MTTLAKPQAPSRSGLNTRHKCRGKAGVGDNWRSGQLIPSISPCGKKGYLYFVLGLSWGDEIAGEKKLEEDGAQFGTERTVSEEAVLSTIYCRLR